MSDSAIFVGAGLTYMALALLIGLGFAAVAYVVFAYATSLWLLLLSRLVQGAGGGTTGVIQAYVADATRPENRAKALGYYENDETVPIYRTSIIPGLANRTGCGDSESCDSKKITVIAKLRHIDTVNDNDFFLLGNLAAIKLMAMAILKEERNLFEESMAYESKAIKELQDELSSFGKPDFVIFNAGAFPADPADTGRLRHINTFGGHPAGCAVALETLVCRFGPALDVDSRALADCIQQAVAELANDPVVAGLRNDEGVFLSGAIVCAIAFIATLLWLPAQLGRREERG